MNWRSLIESILRAQSTGDYKVSPIWHPPVSDAALTNVEETLNVELPDDLKQVLALSDGVNIKMQWADHDIDTGHFLWPTERIKQENLSFRTDSRLRNIGLPVDSVLCFADAGNGDNYGFIISTNRKCTDFIVIHDHETDKYRQMATSLKEFMQGVGI